MTDIPPTPGATSRLPRHKGTALHPADPHDGTVALSVAVRCSAGGSPSCRRVHARVTAESLLEHLMAASVRAVITGSS